MIESFRIRFYPNKFICIRNIHCDTVFASGMNRQNNPSTDPLRSSAMDQMIRKSSCFCCDFYIKNNSCCLLLSNSLAFSASRLRSYTIIFFKSSTSFLRVASSDRLLRALPKSEAHSQNTSINAITSAFNKLGIRIISVPPGKRGLRPAPFRAPPLCFCFFVSSIMFEYAIKFSCKYMKYDLNTLSKTIVYL